MKARFSNRASSAVLHGVNLLALAALGTLLLVTGVARIYQVVALIVGLTAAAAIYWRFRTNLNLVACYFGVALSLVIWTIACENIVFIDNFLGTRFARDISVGVELGKYIESKLRARERVVQECCNDKLSYHYEPGSRHYSQYDCPACKEGYEAVADETGYLNQQRGLYLRSERIDVFLAGDSVIEGYGMPGVVEHLKGRVDGKIWSLSIGGYGARQKVNALIAYAIPKRPRWIVLEFFAGNDVPDAIADEVCLDYRCRYNAVERERRLAAHPRYRLIAATSSGLFDQFRFLSSQYFTLAITRHVIGNAKAFLKAQIVRRSERFSLLSDARADAAEFTDVSFPGNPAFGIRDGMFDRYLEDGLRAVHRDYGRLARKLKDMGEAPSVILLYNPSSYEIYSGILLSPIPKYEKASKIQIAAHRSFAEANGWRFIDLLTPLRAEVAGGRRWLYGKYDGTHWSREGTAVVARVLASELNKIMRSEKS